MYRLCACLLLLVFSLKAEENTLIPCTHGVEMMEDVIKIIGNAEQCIEISLCITGGTIFHKMLQALEERMEKVEDIQVYVLAATTLLCDRDHAAIEHLKKKYPEQFHYEFTLPVFTALPHIGTIDNHMKGVIVDEKYFSLGGSNFDDALISVGTFIPELPPDCGDAFMRDKLPLGNRDQDVIGCSSAIAKELRIYFYQQFALWEHYRKNPEDFIIDPLYFKELTYYQPIDLEKARAEAPSFENSPKKCPVASLHLVITGPEQKNNKIVAEYERLIKNAQEEIIIGNLYFNPPASILQAFQEAIKKGVTSTLITNGLYDNSPIFCPYVAWANRIHYLPLFYAKNYDFWESYRLEKDALFKNINIYEYHVDQIMYHKKVMLIDKRYAVIGSFNLGFRSTCCDYEIILVIDSPQVATHFSKIFEEDLSFSEKITPYQAIEWYFDPFISYLAALQKQFHAFF